MKKAYGISVSIVLALMGVIFVVAPTTWLGTLGVQVSDPSVMDMIRSLGGLYLGIAAFLGLVSVKEGGSDTAILAATLAMAGLLGGRATSLLADGIPARSILASIVVELVLAVWGMVILERERQSGKRTR